MSRERTLGAAVGSLVTSLVFESFAPIESARYPTLVNPLGIYSPHAHPLNFGVPVEARDGARFS